MPQNSPLHIFDFLVALVILLCLITSFSLQSPGSLSIIIRKARHYPSCWTSPYEAPLRLCDFPEDIVKGSYLVHLHYGCSLENHKRTVGAEADLDTKITNVASQDLGGVVYDIENVDDKLLGDIRADIMVDSVACKVIDQEIVLMGDVPTKTGSGFAATDIFMQN